jgi:hypothetical protein
MVVLIAVMAMVTVLIISILVTMMVLVQRFELL